jgi:hypothetical protein
MVNQRIKTPTINQLKKEIKAYGDNIQRKDTF